MLRASEHSRRSIRYVSLLVLLLGGSASAWLLASSYQIVAEGFTVECARMSSLDCRRAGPAEGAYWLALFTRIFMLILAGSAAVFAARMMRATRKPGPNVDAMRARLQQLEALIAQTERAHAASGRR